MHQASSNLSRLSVRATSTSAFPATVPTTVEETTRHLVNATVIRLESQSHTGPPSDNALTAWVTQQLGGTWPTRQCGKNESFRGAPDSAKQPRAVALAFPAMAAAHVGVVATAENNTVASMELASLLTPEAQAGLSALARGTRRVTDADALLQILNAGNEDAWMAQLLSRQAREGLTAVARNPKAVWDSSELLEVLNAGAIEDEEDDTASFHSSDTSEYDDELDSLDIDPTLRCVAWLDALRTPSPNCWDQSLTAADNNRACWDHVFVEEGSLLRPFPIRRRGSPGSDTCSMEIQPDFPPASLAGFLARVPLDMDLSAALLELEEYSSTDEASSELYSPDPIFEPCALRQSQTSKTSDQRSSLVPPVRRDFESCPGLSTMG
ncbi:hypothetical protein B0H11DRAFT_477875 [Mycena galericulata]|nr:hypothetical protein B0H11DRAFT_477875 [Mycena galericulata]